MLSIFLLSKKTVYLYKRMHYTIMSLAGKTVSFQLLFVQFAFFLLSCKDISKV